MPEFHRLDADADARFLQARVSDPLTGVRFRPTNSVVMCRTCGLVSLRETWEALGGCPNGHTAPRPWSEAAALGAGDGAAGTPPRPAPARVEPEKRRWWVPVLVALAVAALLVAGVVAGGLLRDDDVPVEPEEAPVVTAPSGPAAVALAEPGLVEGLLAEGDATDDAGRYRDVYTFAADSSGQVLSFTVTAGDFYPDVVVETPDGERVPAELVSEDPDTGDRVVAATDLRGPGLYRVRVSSRQPGETGAYGLRLRAELPVRPLSAGGSAARAELGEFSERADGFFRDRYRFSGVEGREHTVTVRSSAFAPVVQVTGPNGAAVRGETGRAGGVVTFVFNPAASGTHTLLVSSQSQGQTGAYSAQLAVGPEPRAAAPPEVTSRGVLRGDGRAVTDSLAAGDTRSYTVAGRVGDRIQLEVRTDGFTPSLTVVGPDGTRTPAAPDGDRARLRLTLPTAGTYRVLVGATDGGGVARVTLEQQAAVSADDIPRLPGAEDRPPPDAPPETDGGDPPVDDRERPRAP